MDDVVYIEAMSDHVNIHSVKKNYVAYITFKTVAKQLPRK